MCKNYYIIKGTTLSYWSTPLVLMDSNTLEPSSYGFDKTLQDPNQFFRHGVFIKKRFFDEDQISTLKNKVCKIVEGKYETGIQPDKIKYSKLADGTDYIHSLCNGWKSDVWVKKLFQEAGFPGYVSLLTSWKTVKLNRIQCSVFCQIVIMHIFSSR